MKFSGHDIPGSLFKAARDRMLAGTVGATFTPEEIRQHLMDSCQGDLASVSSLAANQRIVANRVFQEARKQLVTTGEVVQVQRGVWAPIFKR